MSIEFLASFLERRMTSNIYDRDDMTQDAYLARLTQPRQLARQAMVDGLRRFYGRVGPSKSFRPSTIPIEGLKLAYYQDFDGQVLRRELISLMSNLTYSQWLVTWLYYFEGYRGPEIAELMNLTESNIHSLLYQSRTELRAHLTVWDRSFKN